jgi:hypothetical protein
MQEQKKIRFPYIQKLVYFIGVSESSRTLQRSVKGEIQYRDMTLDSIELKYPAKSAHNSEIRPRNETRLHEEKSHISLNQRR